ncbi:MAG TPA: tetratricopeptide repeat protein [Coleofasciculaceae cyanobacterium]|jgi:hypothetical protein
MKIKKSYWLLLILALAYILVKVNAPGTAFMEAEKAVAHKDYNAAKLWLDRALNERQSLKKSTPPEKIDLESVYALYARLYYEQKEFRNSELYMKKALLYAEQKPEKYVDQIGYANNMASMASILYCQNKLSEAEHYIDRAITLYKRYKLDRASLDDAHAYIKKAQNSNLPHKEASGNCRASLSVEM